MTSKIILFTFQIVILSVVLENVASENLKMYKFLSEHRSTWFEADAYCKTINMNLVSIESTKEFHWLKDMLQKKFGHIYPYWIGAYNATGNFQWYHNKENITHFIWHEGEPDNKSGDERCIHTWENDFDWNDNDCETKLPFICERKRCTNNLNGMLNA